MDISSKIVLVTIFIQVSQCYNHYYKYVDKISSNDHNHFSWLVAINDKNHKGIYKIGYGTLIHFKAILTAAQVVKGYAAENLTVEMKCQVDPEIDDNEKPYLINCSSRNVRRIIYQENSDDLNFRKQYAVLILDTRFIITDEVGLIDIAKNFSDINKNDCFIPRWMRLHEKNRNHKTLTTVRYNQSFCDENFVINFMDLQQLTTDRDYIIGEKFHELSDNTSTISFEYDGHEIKVKPNRLSFLGSPLVCKKKSTYIQVGIATLQLTIQSFNILPGSFNLRQDGSVLLIDKFRSSIMGQIYNSLLVCKDFCYQHCSFDWD